jgi:hypothetical protein
MVTRVKRISIKAQKENEKKGLRNTSKEMENYIVNRGSET